MNRVAVGRWCRHRFWEASTHVGWVIAASGNIGLGSTDPKIDQILNIWNHVAPVLGGLLMGMNTTTKEPHTDGSPAQ